MHTQPYTPEPAFDIMLRGKGGGGDERKKFNLTYWSADFHRENADYWCVCMRVCGSIIHSSDWHYMMKKKMREKEELKEESIHSAQTILQCSGLLATGPSIFSPRR